MNTNRGRFLRASMAACVILPLAFCERAAAEDRLLAEAVNFTGTLTYVATKVPGFILVAVRKGEMAYTAFGTTTDAGRHVPDADTMFRIGSISKVFCGEVLASLVLDGTVRFADRLQDRLGYDATLPEAGGQAIRLIDLVTHTAGLPREVPRPDGPPDDPFGTNTREAQIAGMRRDPLLFTPGTAALYSNYGFDLLGAALSHAGGKPYSDLLQERVLAPAGMTDTVFNPRPGDKDRVMQGHDFDGSPMPDANTPASIECAGGLYTTARDMARWMKWHLDSGDAKDRDLRLLDHSAYRYRDGLTSVVGLDDAGPMDAMGLGWVVTTPRDNRPLILQKSGGLQGNFAYLALSPARGVAAFFVMNAFNTAAFGTAVTATNALIAQIAAR